MYNTKTTGNPVEQYQIKTIIDRLEQYRKYQQTIQREKSKRRQNEKKKAFTKIKRDSYRKAYSSAHTTKPVSNPYKYLYEHHRIAIDPNLSNRYKSKPIYQFYEFRHLMLPKSDYEISAGQAWNGLKNSWRGYKISKDKKNKDNMKAYAFTTQRWADMLELPMIPDFDESSLESFLNSRKLKLED